MMNTQLQTSGNCTAADNDGKEMQQMLKLLDSDCLNHLLPTAYFDGRENLHTVFLLSALLEYFTFVPVYPPLQHDML